MIRRWLERRRRARRFALELEAVGEWEAKRRALTVYRVD